MISCTVEYLDKLHSGILRKFAQWYPLTSCMLIKIAQWCSPTSCTMIYITVLHLETSCSKAYKDKVAQWCSPTSCTVIYSIYFLQTNTVARAYKYRERLLTQWYSQIILHSGILRKVAQCLVGQRLRVIVNFVFAWFLYIRCLIIAAYLRRLFHRFFMVLL